MKTATEVTRKRNIRTMVDNTCATRSFRSL
ncbi:hypothetical protein [Weizmannia acidilactici]